MMHQDSLLLSPTFTLFVFNNLQKAAYCVASTKHLRDKTFANFVD